jgi:hypothetical protein
VRPPETFLGYETDLYFPIESLLTKPETIHFHLVYEIKARDILAECNGS